MHILDSLKKRSDIVLREIPAKDLIRNLITKSEIVCPFIFTRGRLREDIGIAPSIPIWLQLIHNEDTDTDFLNRLAFQKPLPLQTLQTWPSLESTTRGHPYYRANAIGLCYLVRDVVLPIEGGDKVIVFHHPINQSEFLYTFWAESEQAARKFVLDRLDTVNPHYDGTGMNREEMRKAIFL